MTERAEVGARTPDDGAKAGNTPTPWHKRPNARHLGGKDGAVAVFQFASDADFALRACNENADLHATVAALRKALEGLDEVLDFDGECEGTQIIERHAVPELRAAMLAARAALALRDPAGKET